MPQDVFNDFIAGLAELEMTADRLWFAGLAARSTSGARELLFGRVVLLTPGSLPPTIPCGTLVRSDLATAVCGQAELRSLPTFLDSLKRNELPPEILAIFGEHVVLPLNSSPNSSWQFRDCVGPSDSRASLILKHHTGGHAYERIGHGTLERINDLLKGAGPEAFDGFLGLVKRIELRDGNFESHMSSPILEVTAELCLRVARFEYSKADRAYVADVQAAAGIPLDKASVAFMPGTHPRFPLADAAVVVNGAVPTERRILLKGAWQETSLKASLLFCGRTVSESIATGKSDSALATWMSGRNSARDETDTTLAKHHGRKWRSVASALTRALPSRIASVAKSRVRDAIRLMNSEPFYSVVASGSVVEALLVIRLRRIGRPRLAKAAAERELTLPSLNWKNPKLADCIDIAEKLALVDGMSMAGLHAVRDARNAVHALVALKRRRGFVVADASAALHLALQLLDALSSEGSRTVPRVRRSSIRKRKVALVRPPSP